MSDIRQHGQPTCWGADEKWSTLPITNLPEGTLKVRRQIRSNNFAKAFVTSSSEIQEWALSPNDSIENCKSLRLGICLGINTITLINK
jgi:hypothetical protein